MLRPKSKSKLFWTAVGYFRQPLPFLSYLWVGSRKTLEVDVEGMILFYLKQDIEILKSNNQTFANSSPEERIELFLYSKKDEETLELEKKLQRQIASNDRYIKRLKNRLQKSQEISKNGKRRASQI